jgi:hypothetical protein
MSPLRDAVTVLVDTQKSLSDLKAMMSAAPASDVGVLADIWNNLLDLRDILIDTILKDDTMRFANGLEVIARRATVLRDQLPEPAVP